MTKEVIAHNTARVSVGIGHTEAPIRLSISSFSNVKGGCQALLTLDQASEVAARLSNLVDAIKRGL